MSPARGVTPNHVTAAMIKLYVAEYAHEPELPALFRAVPEALNDEEVCHLGRAILARHASLAEPDYRIGGELADPDLTAIAERLGS